MIHKSSHGETMWGGQVGTYITHMQTFPITNKHKDILQYIYRFRFINSQQIQTFIHSNDINNTNKLLKYLTVNHYLERKYSTKINERGIPAKFYIGLQGIRYLRTQDYTQKAYLNNLYREKDKKNPFINRCLFIADICIMLQNNTNVSFEIDEFIAPHDFPADSITKSLRPDFGFVKNLKAKKDYTICKILQDGMPRYAVRAVLQKYVTFFKNKADTKLLFICQTEKLYQYAQYFISKYLDELNDEEDVEVPVYIARESEIRVSGLSKDIIKKIS